MKTKKAVFLSVVASLTLAWLPARAQYIDSINWRPAFPADGEDVTLSIVTFTLRVGFEVTKEFRIENNEIAIDVYYAEQQVMAEMAFWDWQYQDCGALEVGEYIIRARVFFLWWGQDQYELNGADSAVMVVSNQALQLAEGWNLISGAFSPNNDDVENLFAGLVERGSLILVKNLAGDFYYPAQEFNSIVHWNGFQGYFVNMAQADVLYLNGERIAPDTTLNLQPGWNAVAYLLDDTVAAPDGFRSIEDALQIAKNGAGEFYVPGSFNNMPGLYPGQGYQVRLSGAAELIWGAR